MATNVDDAIFPVWIDKWLGDYGSENKPIVVSCLQGNRTLTIGDKTKTHYHRGLDFAVPTGTVLRAPEYCYIAGINQDAKRSTGIYIRVLFPAQFPEVGGLGGLGPGRTEAQRQYRRMVARKSIQSGDYLEVWFMHLDSISSTVKKGDWVLPSTVLGYTGNTGDSTGPHLHVQVGLAGSGQWIMPAQLMKKSSFKLSENSLKYKAVYDEQVAPYSYPFSKKIAAGDAFRDVGTRYTELYTSKGWRMNYIWRYELRVPVDSKLPYSTEKTEPIKITEHENATAKSDLLPGIWQIIKLIIDDNVAFRQVFDPTITNSTGSLLNWFNKVCQKPFVEFMGDTWGDQYYFIARRPPFDAEAVKEAYADALYSNNSYLSIHPNKVLGTSLSWSVDTAYSWYRLMARVGFDNADEVGQIPAVFFPEIAALFGSRVCNIQSNYVNLIADGIEGVENQDKTVADITKENVIRAHYRCLLDLKYLIQSTIYTPFTRQGTITMYGDRRIKRGSWIYFVPTRELYYVEQVSNVFKSIGESIQRTTTLQVSHGMLVNNIESAWKDGVYDKNLPYSYFDIVDFGDEENWKHLGEATKEGYPNGLFEAVANFKIRKEVLDYFWSKRHFLDTRTDLYMTKEELHEE